METLKRGTQIIYVPSHANGDIHHEDCERGFVITDKGESVFCRYFNKDKSLRNIANSESTSKTDLVVKNTTDQNSINIWIKNIKHSPEIYGYID